MSNEARAEEGPVDSRPYIKPPASSYVDSHVGLSYDSHQEWNNIRW